jgi:hypothetical protein
MAFDIQAAKKAGYTDKEIQGYLKSQSAYKPNLLNTVLSTGGAIAGGALGGIGGAATGALVPGADLSGVPEVAGGYLGGVAGAGAGSGAGNATADWIRGLFGDKTVNPQQTLNNTPEQVKEGAVSQAIGVPIAKGLGVLAHPIASVMSGDVPFIKGVDSTLAKSSKQIDIGQLINEYKQNVIPEMEKKGVGTDATKAFNKLMVDMTNATSAFKASSKVMDTEGFGMNLSMSQANQLKRNVTQSISDFYGQPTQSADINARKAFGGILKKAIETAEPSVKLPNSIASKLYKAPEFAQGLGQILALGNPKAAKAIEMIGNLPSGIIHKVIPQGGGYLNQALPRSLQLLLQANQADQANQNQASQ